MVGAGVTWLLRPAPPVPSILRPALPVNPAEEVNSGAISSYPRPLGGAHTAFTWTPDGQALVFVGRHGGVQQLYVRRLAAAEAQPLAGTEGAQVLAVSPDGRWVAFWARQAIKKVPLGGGLAVDLAPLIGPPPTGLVWTPMAACWSANTGPILAIPAEGSRPSTVGEGTAAGRCPRSRRVGGACLHRAEGRVVVG
jgi:hypothetical protein